MDSQHSRVLRRHLAKVILDNLRIRSRRQPVLIRSHTDVLLPLGLESSVKATRRGGRAAARGKSNGTCRESGRDAATRTGSGLALAIPIIQVHAGVAGRACCRAAEADL